MTRRSRRLLALASSLAAGCAGQPITEGTTPIDASLRSGLDASPEVGGGDAAVDSSPDARIDAGEGDAPLDSRLDAPEGSSALDTGTLARDSPSDSPSPLDSGPGPWTLIPSVAAPVAIGIAPNDGMTTPFVIYVGTAGNGVFASSDGVAWASSGPSSVVAVAPMPMAGVSFVSLPDGSAQMTRDSGMTWAPTPSSPGAVIQAWVGVAGVGPLGVAPTSGDAVIVLDGKGGGTQWSASSAFGGGVPTSIASGGGTSPMATAYAGVSGASGGVFKSTSIGSAAPAFSSTTFPETEVLSLATSASSPSTLFAGTDGQGAGVYVSNDGAGTWSPSGAGLGGAIVQAIAVDPTTGANLYAGTRAGVYVSTNGGSSWSLSGLAAASVVGLAIQNGSPSTVYAVTSLGLYVTMTGGR